MAAHLVRLVHLREKPFLEVPNNGCVSPFSSIGEGGQCKRSQALHSDYIFLIYSSSVLEQPISWMEVILLSGWMTKPAFSLLECQQLPKLPTPLC